MGRGTKILTPSVRPLDYVNGTAEAKAAAIRAAGLSSQATGERQLAYEVTSYRAAYSPPQIPRHGATKLMGEHEREAAAAVASRNMEAGMEAARGAASSGAYVGLKQALQRGSLATPSAFAAMMAEDEARAAAAERERQEAEYHARAQAHAEAQAQAEYEQARAQAEYEQARAQAQYEQAQAEAQYEAQAQAQYEAQAQAQYEAQAQAQYEAQAQAQYEAQAQAQYEAQAQAQYEAQAQAQYEAQYADERAYHAAATPQPRHALEDTRDIAPRVAFQTAETPQPARGAAVAAAGEPEFEYYYEEVVVADPQAELRAYQEEQKRKVLEYNLKLQEDKQRAAAMERLRELQEAREEQARAAAAEAAEQARVEAARQKQVAAAQEQLRQVEERQRREAQEAYAEQMAERRRLETLQAIDAANAAAASDADRVQLARSLQQQIAAKQEREMRERVAEARSNYESSLPLRQAYSVDAAERAQAVYRAELLQQIELARQRKVHAAVRELHEDQARAHELDARASATQFDWNEHRANVRKQLQEEWKANVAAKNDRVLREQVAEIHAARAAIERDAAAAAAERAAAAAEQENARHMAAILKAQMENKRQREIREALYDAQFAAPNVYVNEKGQHVQRVRRRRRKQ